MLGCGQNSGRLTRAIDIARKIGVDVEADDKVDIQSKSLMESMGINVFQDSTSTEEEVVGALKRAQGMPVLFVSSPDHLPRVVRDALKHGAVNCFFAASEVPFSANGVASVEIIEPKHKVFEVE
jgi:hypothetical protein